MRVCSVCLVMIVLIGFAACSWSADAQPVRAVAQRITKPPVIDGKLDDSAWSKARELSGFVLLNAGEKPAAETRVKVLTDGTSLYFGFKCAEPNMDQLVARQTERDSQVWTDDSVEVILDPTHDRKGLLHLVVNSAGARYDATVKVTQGATAADPAWNGDWEAAGSKGKKEWYVEIKLPFSSLGVSPDEVPCMGVNFARERVAGARELSSWSPTADLFVNPARLGELIIPAADNSYITVDLTLPDSLYVGKQTTPLTITNKSKKKIELRFAYDVTGTANMVGNTEFVTVHPGRNAEGSYTLDMGGAGLFHFTARVEDRNGRIYYSVGRDYEVPGPVVVEELMYRLYHGKAEASLAVNLSPEQMANGELLVSLIAAGVTAPVEEKTIKGPLANPTPVSFDLSARPAGRYYIQVELRQADKAISRARSLPMPYKPDAPVGFDANGFLTVDGKPYFPVGMYTLQDGKGTDHDAVLREASEAGFNTTVFYAYTIETVTPLLDAAGRNGIKAFVYPTGPFSVVGADATLANAAKDVALRKNHPALLGWYLVDEPEGIGKAAVDKTRELYQIVKEADPNHPCSLVIMSPGAAAKYRACTDIMWIDPYPIPHSPVTYVTSCVSGAVKAVEKDKPVWTIPQAFDWNVWNTGKINGVHRPTNEEERCMTYLALVQGAKGIIYWAHTASKYYIRDYPDHWAYMKRLAGEMHDLTPVLLTPDSEVMPALEPKDAPVDLMVKKLGGETYVFAVNHDTKACTVKLSLPGMTASSLVEVLFETRSVAAADGAWQDDFKPLEVHVYKVAAP